MKFPKRNVTSVAKECARSPSKASKFDIPAGVVTLASLVQFFDLVRGCCPKCKTGFAEIDICQFGACLKAKLVCRQKHLATWSSSDGMVLWE
jgi:hypothetical protein